MCLIGVSRSEPRINHSYEKIAVLMYMYVCMYICMAQYAVHVLIVQADLEETRKRRGRGSVHKSTVQREIFAGFNSRGWSIFTIFTGLIFCGCTHSCPLCAIQSSLFRGFNFRGQAIITKTAKLDPSKILRCTIVSFCSKYDLYHLSMCYNLLRHLLKPCPVSHIRLQSQGS